MDFLKLTSTWLGDLLDMVFPRVCEVCGRQLVDGERLLCLHCDVAMPRTSFHHDNFNAMHRRLVGKMPVERAAAWFEYRRGSEYVKLIHRAKYHDRPEIAVAIGERLAAEIKGSGFFTGIDIILPVPMHTIKQLRRGYNQAFELARGISGETGIPISDNLVMLHRHSSQTRRGAYDRYKNTEGIFGVRHPQELEGKHILLVDDVLTTGSTILGCIDVLASEVASMRVSVLTAASTVIS